MITKLGQTPHTHAADEPKLKAQSILRRLKERCQTDARPMPSLYDEELAMLRTKDFITDNPDHHSITQALPTFEACRASLYRARSRVRPPLPPTRSDIALDGRWTTTLAGDRFLLSDEGDANRMLIFATDDNLTHLANATTIFGDGTFYAAPALFSQLYSLHAEVNGSTYPLVYALLPGKSEHLYTRLLHLLKDACLHITGLQLNPDVFFADFETAIRNAIHTVFPTTTIRGCFFHYTQAIWRRTQAEGLAVLYREDPDIQRFIRRAAVLPLIPMPLIDDVWFQALEDINLHPTNVTPFADYVTEYWVEGDRQRWNHFTNQGPRTNNNVEGWHSRINKKLNHGHPNIFQLIELLQKEQATTEATRIQLSAGGKRKLKKKKYQVIDRRLMRLKQRLVASEMTVMEYADAASHLLHLDEWHWQ